MTHVGNWCNSCNPGIFFVQIEQDMTFIGLLVMQNALKEESAPVIKILHNANIRTVMITGDNLYTAISVARNCDMISPHAKVLVIKVENDDNSQLPKIFVDNVDTLVDDREVALNLFDNVSNNLSI